MSTNAEDIITDMTANASIEGTSSVPEMCIQTTAQEQMDGGSAATKLDSLVSLQETNSALLEVLNTVLADFEEMTKAAGDAPAEISRAKIANGVSIQSS